jgi:hypothetical protein
LGRFAALNLYGPTASFVGGEQRLNLSAEFDVGSALAVQVGGTLRRIGQVRRVEE